MNEINKCSGGGLADCSKGWKTFFSTPRKSGGKKQQTSRQQTGTLKNNRKNWSSTYVNDFHERSVPKAQLS